MIRIFCPVIDEEIIEFARLIAEKKQVDVMIETHDEYMEIHPEGSEKK